MNYKITCNISTISIFDVALLFFECCHLHYSCSYLLYYPFPHYLFPLRLLPYLLRQQPINYYKTTSANVEVVFCM